MGFLTAWSQLQGSGTAYIPEGFRRKYFKRTMWKLYDLFGSNLKNNEASLPLLSTGYSEITKVGLDSRKEA